ncbi:uncharacterized protein N7515_000270 [Penicillium bovifimosum]|uniref:Gfd2/YDR514C-like C-terminal domain-containing protein n=1 Tax=Penicillium bovifimosum TaxID=126998 RepID=A0A9W9LBA6_9EURO|nr:uncharacterized protein N7515_000270 [Penicillium bovifimosum]KAJ5145706.1 hypothetical protein N7515_000270 [Penicillium bovifimosum]
MEKDEALMHLATASSSQGEGTVSIQDNGETPLLSGPAVGLASGILTAAFSEPQAKVKDPDWRSCGQSLTETKDVDCSHNTRKVHLECPSAAQDKHDDAHSDKTSESQLTAVPTSYYLPVPKEISRGPFLLIPTLQAQGFLDEINSALNLQLTLTGQGKKGLVIKFNETTVQPTFLGRCSTPEQKADYEGMVPDSLDDWGPGTMVVGEFEEQIKQSIATIKRVKKKKKNGDSEARQKKWEECMGRVQAHFGLRPPLQPGHQQPSFANGQIGPVDVLDVTKWDFHDAPIFISIDLEWKENTLGALTEVGISTLDMMDLQGVPPGGYGENWMKHIRSRHLRVSEYRTWVNNKYSYGCPDRFAFGESEMIPGAEIGEAVDAAFQPPYMVPKENDIVRGYKRQKRTVILVGIDLRHDFRILKEQNSQVFLGLETLDGSSPVVREVVDVAQLYRVEHGMPNPPSLESMLNQLKIPSANLHNAGNDASCTLRALVRLMLEVAGEETDVSRNQTN